MTLKENKFISYFGSCVFLILVLAVGAVSADGCRSQSGGIGGTGHTKEDGGIGGTGHETGGGIGGTGITDQDGGIGGTGHSGKDGGIGGTGDLAEGETIGIIGTINEFASVCVNGVEVHYNPDTPVKVDGKSVTHKALAIGQVVKVVAKNVGNRMVAQSIQVDHPISGPISSVNHDKGRIQVLGQTVEIGRRSIISDGFRKSPRSIETLRKGQYVKISGLRRPNGNIAASRIEGAARSGRVRISGKVLGRKGALISIKGLTVRLHRAQSIRQGDFVAVQGTLQHDKFTGGVATVESPIPFGGAISRINVEGFLQRAADNKSLRIGRTDLSISEKTIFRQGDKSQVLNGRRATVLGQVTKQGRIDVDEVIFEGRIDRSRGASTSTQPGASDRNSNESETSNREDKTGRSSRTERTQRTERSERNERSERPNRVDRPERPNRPERPERPNRPERPERANRPERPERVNRPDRPDRVDRPDRPDRADRPDRPDRSGRN